MPESPEVDALVGFLDDSLRGRRITGIEVVEFRAWKSRDRPPESFIGAPVTGVRRFGKHVALLTDRDDLVIGLGRAGWIRIRATGDAAAAEDEPPAIVGFAFDDGTTLEVTDAGEWLSIAVTAAEDPVLAGSVARLGPDPLGQTYTRADFDRALGTRRKQLKALLQEQQSMAGIGNAYSDEILHAAGLSPVVRASDLDDAERDRLYAAVRTVLSDAARDRRGIPISDQKAAKVAAMRVHGRTGEPCPVCGVAIEDLPGSKGGAQYCPGCQTGGVPLGG
ncbi:DNA-formamidopyrimidine glycosylase family protein [Microbacterium thalassium]|uniref:Formamidopyrimidine-DNA glycosylase n=1 Tax=Microbacterium thalassium TaxID=362649 RepID=A0A7X0FRH6_9MICO|nr:DNA-formamidopyrimidine glycosylase family protein [Microbacterium thalassium]MBB6392349.1 formamidopyrimidine-DNA glycosylase [Microbacterium thalassium]GLK23559.1 formamidopyrimidine-DNA glycosylase [Microbacterium thalassium]